MFAQFATVLRKNPVQKNIPYLSIVRYRKSKRYQVTNIPGVKEPVPKQKRPPNAFGLYVKEQLPIVFKDSKVKHNPVKFSVLAKIWKNLSMEEKQPYYDQYKLLKELIPPNDKLVPKKPAAGFGAYVKSQYHIVQKENPEMASQDVMILLARMYRLLTQEEKEIISNRVKIEMEKYKYELEKLEDKYRTDHFK